MLESSSGWWRVLSVEALFIPGACPGYLLAVDRDRYGSPVVMYRVCLQQVDPIGHV